MTNNYLRHPAYASYPVVGVNWIQAVEFSKWRTDRVNEAILEKKWILKRVLKQTTSLLKALLVRRPIGGSTMTYGGDEEIVLKGGAKKSVKAGKDGESS
jgi:hypothetical protein